MDAQQSGWRCRWLSAAGSDEVARFDPVGPEDEAAKREARLRGDHAQSRNPERDGDDRAPVTS